MFNQALHARAFSWNPMSYTPQTTWANGVHPVAPVAASCVTPIAGRISEIVMAYIKEFGSGSARTIANETGRKVSLISQAALRLERRDQITSRLEIVNAWQQPIKIYCLKSH
jgi:hypothetical protein